MASRAVNLRLDESEILDIKRVAAIFNTTLTAIIREALKEYLSKKKNDPYYRLTANVELASNEESAEILNEIEGLSDDDLAISSIRKFQL